MIEQPGLRERKKAETRLALGAAALALALDRGLDGVTADDIAAAANVSPRTFHNYFGNKEEALIAGFHSILATYLEELAARPADEPILTSLEAVLGGMAAEAARHRQEAAAHLELFASPALTRYRGLFVEEAVRAFTDVVASRTGTDARTDVYPRLLTTAAVSAVVTVYDVAGAQDVDHAEASRRLRECFEYLRHGLERPDMGVT